MLSCVHCAAHASRAWAASSSTAPPAAAASAVGSPRGLWACRGRGPLLLSTLCDCSARLVGGGGRRKALVVLAVAVKPTKATRARARVPPLKPPLQQPRGRRRADGILLSDEESVMAKQSG